MADILKTKPLVAHIEQQMIDRLHQLEQPPHVHVVLVGDNKASRLYVKKKQKAASALGIQCSVHYLPEDISQESLNDFIKSLDRSPEVTGVLLQLPVPKALDGYEALNFISPQKDIDGLTHLNQQNLVNCLDGLRPATPLGVMRILKWYNVDIKHKTVVVLGESKLVGNPIAEMLRQAGAEVQTFNSESDLSEKEAAMKAAHVIVSAAGCANLVHSGNISDHAIIIDVGINHVDGKLMGDCSPILYKKEGLKITPVPGGVGPMTVASLLTNVIDAALWQAGKNPHVWVASSSKEG